MKTIVSFEKEIGSGAKASGALAIEGDQLVAQAKLAYPLAKVVEPATSAFDKAMDKVEALIPGDWDKGPIAKIKADFKAEFIKLLSENPA